MVGYLGPKGSYSHLAAIKLGFSDESRPYATFGELINAIKNGECARIILPIENTLNGGVLQNLDLLYYENDIYAVGEHVLPIEHRLIIRNDGDFKNVKRIISHRQAIEQCSRYLTAHYPDCELIYADSTAKGVGMIEEKTDAGIVGAHNTVEGYRLSEEVISDETENYTHFLLIERGMQSVQKHSHKIFFAASMAHEPGTLLKLLSIMHVYGMNMTKIESRPNKKSRGEYVFFIEVEADYLTAKTQSMLRLIEETAIGYKLLGTY